jgi:hypothetical protein
VRQIAPTKTRFDAEHSLVDPKVMKSPTLASLKRVNAENLANLGAERLAEILVQAADSRPDLKRRLRMELAAEQGADHLVVEIDKRLVSLETSRSKVSWRKRASFVGDLDLLRSLIVDRLAGLDATLALDRMWVFMDLARRLGVRVRDRDGPLGQVFERAAGDIGGLTGRADPTQAAAALAEAIGRDPRGWSAWLPSLTASAPRPTVEAALSLLRAREDGLSHLYNLRQVIKPGRYAEPPQRRELSRGPRRSGWSSDGHHELARRPPAGARRPAPR